MKEHETIALCLDVKASSWMFLHLCLYKASSLGGIVDAISIYLTHEYFWHLNTMMAYYLGFLDDVIDAVRDMCTEVSKLGLSPSEVISP